MARQSCFTLGLATLAAVAVADTPAPSKPSIVHVIADVNTAHTHTEACASQLGSCRLLALAAAAREG